MLKSHLQFSYPEELVATFRQTPTRVMQVQGSQEPRELTLPELLNSIPSGDLLVINETRVLKRRVFSGDLEILFLEEVRPREWQVLFPAKGYKLGALIELPAGVEATLAEKGRPQILKVNQDLDEAYFERFGEMPLPPYIQKARGERHQREEDNQIYQTAWANQPGSLAAPTASLHFSEAQIQELQARGVQVHKLVLHVGLGTFLPILTDSLDDHTMHAEKVEIPRETWEQSVAHRKSGKGVWALGTTVARSLEAAARGHFKESENGLLGETQLFMKPGSEWMIVNRLLTNFHQPESTLLALVGSFAGLDRVKQSYAWAIDRKFRLFSYGDLTAWIP